MPAPTAVVLGGGLAGMAAAYALARSGLGKVTVVERGPELGGLAGTFERDGHDYPLAYHHILHRDTTLLYFLDLIGALPRVRWRKIRMLFRLGGRLYDLAHPVDFLRFPMSVMDKARFVRLMLRCFRKKDWSDWRGRSARELVDRWGGPGVRAVLFDPLTHLKFDLPPDAVSGAWLGARLHYREGSAPLGYIPGSNWTMALCEGLTRLLSGNAVRVLLNTSVASLSTGNGRITGAALDNGTRLDADLFVSALPTVTYRRLVPGDGTPGFEDIRYTAILSAVCATRQKLPADFYWMNLLSRDLSSCGLFVLSSLNPTIGAPGDTCLNFVTHLPSREHPMFHRSDEELLAAYREDFRRIFGFGLEPLWAHVSRLPLYSPVFLKEFQLPPARSTSWANLYYAGNYRTFPSIASTGTAIASGIEAAEAALADRGLKTDLPSAVASFRLRSMPRE